MTKRGRDDRNDSQQQRDGCRVILRQPLNRNTCGAATKPSVTKVSYTTAASFALRRLLDFRKARCKEAPMGCGATAKFFSASVGFGQMVHGEIIPDAGTAAPHDNCGSD